MTDPRPENELDLIVGYSRREAIADGVLVEASEGDFAATTRQFFKVPVAMTEAVFAMIDSAEDWHQVCRCLITAISHHPPESTEPELLVSLPRGSSHWTVKAVMGPDDEGAACLTLMLPDED